MLLTEKQAREKWCPQARVIVHSDDAEDKPSCAANRIPAVGVGEIDSGQWPDARCIASDCTMWRWADAENRENFYAWAEAASRSEREDAREKGQPIHRGYCGLAGRP